MAALLLTHHRQSAGLSEHLPYHLLGLDVGAGHHVATGFGMDIGGAGRVAGEPQGAPHGIDRRQRLRPERHYLRVHLRTVTRGAGTPTAGRWPVRGQGSGGRAAGARARLWRAGGRCADSPVGLRWAKPAFTGRSGAVVSG